MKLDSERSYSGTSSLIAALAILVCAPACGRTQSGPAPELVREVIEHYADGVFASYSASLRSVVTLDAGIDAFLANPTQAGLEDVKRSWLAGRTDYSPTEAFRFYGGPIDDDWTGVEGFINAWPLDESYIDYVEGYPGAGIINRPDEYPLIDLSMVLAMNGLGGEANISTGWHAIEFLLWGQDMNPDGPGDRPLTDYTTGPNAERRRAYLAITSDLLVSHMKQLVNAWRPEVDHNYRASFLSLADEDALRKILTGIGEMSSGELAAERLYVAYEERTQEDETSCFSDNSTVDVVDNALGIQMVYTGGFPGTPGVGIHDLVEATDRALASRLKGEIEQSVALAQLIPAPFDQHLRPDVPHNSSGRQAILSTIEALEKQTDTIVEAAEKIGATISVS